MVSYTVEQLRDDGPQYAMALLLNALESGEPFVTYGAIKRELENQWAVDTIFPTQIGHVAGSLMNQILELDENAPLINVLITRGNGIPGAGVSGYLYDRYRKRKYKNFDSLPKDEQIAVVERERELVFNYPHWNEISESLFGNEVQLIDTPTKFDDHQYGSGGESNEHKSLKHYIANNPKSIGLGTRFGVGDEEASLLSGDIVDVTFASGTDFKMVEVKSIKSSDDDLRRGVYQCIKYREVKKAEHAPYLVNVESILVTERELPEELRHRAKTLGVRHKIVVVN
ncbi:hypothetical protein [Vibrio owensii]|uniref:hypothetical protein n=1 Tax=Vibrio owensii TaxID=696485 RepID=UPI0005EE0D55|nr:hypothetical protein [Vibrio owensii]